MGKLTWDEAIALVRRGSRPWGMTEDLDPSIQPVDGFDYPKSLEESEFAKRVVRDLRRVITQVDSETK